MTMFRDAIILSNDGILDVEALERYIVEQLDGIIGYPPLFIVTP